jgi:hypothetical protein
VGTITEAYGLGGEYEIKQCEFECRNLSTTPGVEKMVKEAFRILGAIDNV